VLDPDRSPGRAPASQKCYNLLVTSLDDRFQIESPARRPQARTRVPPVFVLGVAMMVAVVGAILLRGPVPRDSLVASDSPSPVDAGDPALAGSPYEMGSEMPMETPSGTLSPGPSWSSPSPDPADDLTGYVWPLVDARVTLPFGPTSWGEFIVDGQLFHDGVDMATQCGDNVHAAHDGVVLAASRQYDDYMGWTGDLAPYYHLLDTKHWWDSLPIVIVIDDGDGYRSIYAHESRVIVKPGQHVKAGQVIGYEGATGNATGCHVHFGLFSPTETATFQLDPAVVARDLLPSSEIARIDPLLVLPFRCEISEMRTLRPVEAAPCPPLPSANPSSSAPAGKTARAAPTPTPTPSDSTDAT
jgi:murein DD-endopeptidase MepM/ murein hydrolase activator NlpD